MPHPCLSVLKFMVEGIAMLLLMLEGLKLELNWSELVSNSKHCQLLVDLFHCYELEYDL